MKHTADQKEFRAKKRGGKLISSWQVWEWSTQIWLRFLGQMKEPCTVCWVQFSPFRAYMDKICHSRVQSHSVLTEVCHLWCVCDASVYIHLTFITAHHWSANMSLQLWPLKKAPLKPHSDYCGQSLSAQCREGNRALSWLLFYLKFIQNVSGIVGPGPNSPSPPASPTPKTHQ